MTGAQGPAMTEPDLCLACTERLAAEATARTRRPYVPKDFVDHSVKIYDATGALVRTIEPAAVAKIREARLATLDPSQISLSTTKRGRPFEALPTEDDARTWTKKYQRRNAKTKFLRQGLPVPEWLR